MKPTPELRWVERIGPVPEYDGHNQRIGQTVVVLQQKWAYADGSLSEWRDVPTVKEQP